MEEMIINGDIMRRLNDTKYYISCNGKVLNSKSKKELKLHDSSKGYVRVALTNNGTQSMKYVHRLVAELFIENKENKPQVNHIDGDKKNNNVLNLEWSTNGENQLHACANGLRPLGDMTWNGKFSKLDIKFIIKMNQLGVKNCVLTRIMKCSNSTISDIINRKTYKHITKTLI